MKVRVLQLDAYNRLGYLVAAKKLTSTRIVHSSTSAIERRYRKRCLLT
jgi:hypothetical protein